MVFSCISGYISGYYCQNHNATANAGTTLGGNGYGYWDAYASHWYIQGGVSQSLSDTHILLYAGSPPPTPEQECADQGLVYDPNTHECAQPPNCPIIIATSNAAVYRLTSAKDGVLFDIDADGTPEKIAWTERNSDVAFLAIDRDGDGIITSGKELFGNHTLPGIQNGFDALIQLAKDTNDGIIAGSVSTQDPIFARLVLWTDRNHNGLSEPSELQPVQDLFSDIGLGYRRHNRRDAHDNRFVYRGWATIRTASGRNKAENPVEMKDRGRPIYDVVLASLP